jgi:hypothetical protein
MRKVKSIKGEEVDFDLLQIKQQLDSAPAEDIIIRERFIDTRKRRGTKKTMQEVVERQKASLEMIEKILAKKKEEEKKKETLENVAKKESKPTVQAADLDSSKSDIEVGQLQESKRKIIK